METQKRADLPVEFHTNIENNSFGFDYLFYHSLGVVEIPVEFGLDAIDGFGRRISNHLRVSIPAERKREVTNLYFRIKKSDIGSIVVLVERGFMAPIRELLTHPTAEIGKNYFALRRRVPLTDGQLQRFFLSAYRIRRRQVASHNLRAKDRSECKSIPEKERIFYKELLEKGVQPFSSLEITEILKGVIISV